MVSCIYEPGRLIVSSTNLHKGFPCILLLEFFTTDFGSYRLSGYYYNLLWNLKHLTCVVLLDSLN